MSVLKISSLPVPVAPYEEQIQIKQITQQLLQSLSRYRSIQDECQGELQRLNQSILAKAFRGELVPQDPNDEPASALLERLRAERETKSPGENGEKRKGRGR